jgi:hypothetical protein
MDFGQANSNSIGVRYARAAVSPLPVVEDLDVFG